MEEKMSAVKATLHQISDINMFRARRTPMRVRTSRFAAFFCGCLAFIVSSIAQADVLFTDFALGNIFDTGGGWTIAGPGIPNGPFNVAMNFTSPVAFDVTQIDIALTHSSGPNAATVGLYNDDGGLLGTLVQSWSVAGFPSFGSSGPVTTISGISGVHLIAGNRYYLRTTADTDSVDAWNFNALGISGQVLHAQGNPDIQEFSAFDIIGTPTAAVPGPVVGAGLPGLLLAGSALLAWWCKKWKATAVAG
jgi:hypothetical protein